MAEPLRILIADDQPRARESLKALLSTWHRTGEVWEAGNGREAVRLVAERQPDLVLMDVRMPEMDGIQASAAVKAQWPSVKIVVLSMYSQYRDEALATGADAFVGKGDAPGALLELLVDLMEVDRCL